jgi:hypothetical protein
MRPKPKGTLFLHYPCFDGLVSAAIASDFLENRMGWAIRDVQRVNYDLSPTWVETRLPEQSAVVDFLYHPDAVFWADHHATTFASDAARAHCETNADRRILLYDKESPSCGMLLFRRLGNDLSDRVHYGEMARWADLIDGAQYASVEQAVSGEEPAFVINASLTGVRDAGELEFLLEALRSRSLAEIAALPQVRSRADDVRSRTEAGLRLVKKEIRLAPGGIAVFAVTPSEGDIVNRYSPYCFFPDARYSVALIESPKDAKITAMRNPWIDFESVPLGQIFRKYGGGGHQRVASVVIPAGAALDPRHVVSEIVRTIRELSVPARHEERQTA